MSDLEQVCEKLRGTRDPRYLEPLAEILQDGGMITQLDKGFTIMDNPNNRTRLYLVPGIGDIPTAVLKVPSKQKVWQGFESNLKKLKEAYSTDLVKVDIVAGIIGFTIAAAGTVIDVPFTSLIGYPGIASTVGCVLGSIFCIGYDLVGRREIARIPRYRAAVLIGPDKNKPYLVAASQNSFDENLIQQVINGNITQHDQTYLEELIAEASKPTGIRASISNAWSDVKSQVADYFTKNPEYANRIKKGLTVLVEYRLGNVQTRTIAEQKKTSLQKPRAAPQQHVQIQIMVSIMTQKDM